MFHLTSETNHLHVPKNANIIFLNKGKTQNVLALVQCGSSNHSLLSQPLRGISDQVRIF